MHAHLLLRPTHPRCLIQRSNYQVIIANDFWLLLHEVGCQKMLHVILMGNQQIAVRAVAAGLVEREEIRWINMNE